MAELPIIFVSSLTHLQSALKKPLLTQEQEFKLLAQYWAWQDVEELRDRAGLVDAVAERLSIPVLSINTSSPRYQQAVAALRGDEHIAAQLGIELGVLRKRVNAGIRAKQQLIERNLRLIVRIAKKLSYQGNFDDLISDGVIGMDRAISKYDPTKGAKLSTYAYLWILQEMQRGVARRTPRTPLKKHIWERQNKIARCYEQHWKSTGRYPNAQRLAELTGYTLDQVKEALTLTSTASLDWATKGRWDGCSNGLTIKDSIQDDSDIWQDLANREIEDMATDLLSELDPHIKRVLLNKIQETGKIGSRTVELQLVAACYKHRVDSSILG